MGTASQPSAARGERRGMRTRTTTTQSINLKIVSPQKLALVSKRISKNQKGYTCGVAFFNNLIEQLLFFVFWSLGTCGWFVFSFLIHVQVLFLLVHSTW